MARITRAIASEKPMTYRFIVPLPGRRTSLYTSVTLQHSAASPQIDLYPGSASDRFLAKVGRSEEGFFAPRCLWRVGVRSVSKSIHDARDAVFDQCDAQPQSLSASRKCVKSCFLCTGAMASTD